MKEGKKISKFFLLKFKIMWEICVFFIGLILTLIGIWLLATAMNTLDPNTINQKKTWSFVLLVIGLFLIILAAAFHHHWGVAMVGPGTMAPMKYY